MANRSQTVYLTEEEHQLLELLAARSNRSKHATAQALLRTGIQEEMGIGSQAGVLEEAWLEYNRALRANIERTKEEIAEKRLKKLPLDKQFVSLVNREAEAREFVQGLSARVRNNVLRQFKDDPFLEEKFRSYMGSAEE